MKKYDAATEFGPWMYGIAKGMMNQEIAQTERL
jgi:hypothetical protein